MLLLQFFNSGAGFSSWSQFWPYLFCYPAGDKIWQEIIYFSAVNLSNYVMKCLLTHAYQTHEYPAFIYNENLIIQEGKLVLPRYNRELIFNYCNKYQKDQQNFIAALR